jgi:8-oxo-dGTP diphosphatase
MIHYCVGSVFYRDASVALVQKLNPKWQKGLFNGIGGKIEEGETPLQAMDREWNEETGHPAPTWTKFCLLTDFRGWEVHFYTASVEGEDWDMPKENDRGEPLSWKPVDLYDVPHVSNLEWLIPMALCSDQGKPFLIVEKGGDE